MTSKSKSKGNRLEREVCDALNAAFNVKEFTRTPSSGALMGLSNAAKNKDLEQSTKQVLGSDIICPSWFKWSIECKNYADSPAYNKILFDDDTKLNGWLGETLFDSDTMQLSPLLVFRTTRKGTFVAIPKIFSEIILDFDYFLYYNGFWIVSFDSFISNVVRINEFNSESLSPILESLKGSRYELLKQQMLAAKSKAKPKKKDKTE